MDKELERIFARFSDEVPESFRVISTGRSETDFRDTVIVTAVSGNRLVLKLSDNDFTFPDKIGMWQRTAEEYRALGCYCPHIWTDKEGVFPVTDYRGHKCTVYAEEYSLYPAAEERETDFSEYRDDAVYMDDAWLLTAKVAAKQFGYTEYPSGYCLFETFCPSDKTDEVLENALEWIKLAEVLPQAYKAQTQRIKQLWYENREMLERLYPLLPRSVFQADLNSTNILVDEERHFKGLMDFNLCGRDVFLNYLMRENRPLEQLQRRLRLVSSIYSFSDLEKQAAPLLYRCLAPLWISRVEKLKQVSGDDTALREFLDETERMLTEDCKLDEFMTPEGG